MVMNVNNFFIKADNFCDYVPIISIVSNLADLIEKCVVLPFLFQEEINANHYFKHLKNKDTWVQ